MRRLSRNFRVCLAGLLCLVATLPFAMAQGSGIRSNPSSLDFGSHDLGTTTPLSLSVTNTNSAAANVTITLSGDNASDFSWDAQCLSSLPPGSKCLIVSFAPLTIGKPERNAQLSISDGKNPALTVTLKGSAFQNLGVSPNILTFDDQLVNTASAARTVVVTNYSESTLSSLAIAIAGDFTESHSKCEKITPGASCAISVAFAPKISGDTRGSLTITADQSNLSKLPRVLVLQGRSCNHCTLPEISLRSRNALLAFLIPGLYFFGLVLVRWHMIAKPARAQLIAQISTIRAQLIAETAGLPTNPAREARINRIHYLLDHAVYPFKNKNFPVERDTNGNEISLIPGWFPPYTRFYNAVFWPRGQELAGWTCAHEAELEMIALLPPERVRARMETAVSELRVIDIPVSNDLAARLKEAVAPNAGVSDLRAQALLSEALGVIYSKRDTAYFQLASWHSKMIWLVASALLFILALAVTLQNAILLLLGAVGGLLSRLTRSVKAADVANDYGASWGALFLSPLSGALSAWGGILLIVLGKNLEVLGPAVKADWCNPYDPTTMAIALLFGFSERLFEGVASQVEGKLVKAPPSGPSPDGTSPNGPAGGGSNVPKAQAARHPAQAAPPPTVTSISPADVPLGKATPVTVTGTNFQSGATATVTDEHANPVPAKLDFKDATTALLTINLSGRQRYQSTLTIVNPDKQSATFKFKVV